jgi:methylenetetrahydrofolate dehydrogenase (NADP+) / methenyltetrahydrofolate cyclohydrolase
LNRHFIRQFIRLSGTDVAKHRQVILQERIQAFTKRAGRKPGLAVVIVGHDPASQVYVRNKVKTTLALGMDSFHFELPESISESDLIRKVKELNQDPKVDGILVQLPLPKSIRSDKVIEAIDPKKDPDGLTVGNLGLLMTGKKRVAPCTPWGVIAILEHYKIPIAGQNAVVVGRSNIVGKPMAQLLLDANATVTICHSRTKDLGKFTREADIVVVAAGQPRFMGREFFRKDAVVVDVGMHRPVAGDFAGKLCGDVKFEELEGWSSAATPVPGGVGPMTIQMLMENTVYLAELSADHSREKE